MIPKEAIEAFYGKAEVTSRGTILNMEAALTAAFAAMSEPVAWVRQGTIEELHKDGSHIGVTSTLWLNEVDEGKRHSIRVPLYAAPQPAAVKVKPLELDPYRAETPFGYYHIDDQRDRTPDDLAVDRFAAAMKAKLAKKRADGFGGWDDPQQCHIDYLVSLLMEQIQERAVLDPVDIANLSMMIHERGETPDYGR